jgi:7-cyano-7-deazaguanine reductase
MNGREARPRIETFTNELKGKRDFTVKLEIQSLIANCPLTGASDLANLVIEYVPNERCVETKAMRQFISYWKDWNTLGEQITNWILECFVNDVQPKRAKITARFEARGNINISVEAEWREGDWVYPKDTFSARKEGHLYGDWRCVNREWEATFPPGSIWNTKHKIRK